MVSVCDVIESMEKVMVSFVCLEFLAEGIRKKVTLSQRSYKLFSGWLSCCVIAVAEGQTT